MALEMDVKLGFLILLVANGVFTLPEQGKWEENITESKSIPYTKSMYNESQIFVKITCNSKNNDAQIRVKWLLRYTQCAEEYVFLETAEGAKNAEFYLTHPTTDSSLMYKEVHFQKSTGNNTQKCNGEVLILSDESTEEWSKRPAIPMKTVAKTDGKTGVSTNSSKKDAGGKTSETSARSKRAAVQEGSVAIKPPKKPDAQPPEKKKEKGNMKHPGKETENYVVARTWEDGVYLFVLNIDPVEPEQKFSAEVEVWMRGPHGYLSAIEWPLLPFYGTMCFVYIVYGIVWLVLSACNWRDLLRIQFWIGGVIFLGMLEKAVFCGEYSSINYTGKSVRGAVIFAEIVSCLKRTLARMLVVIVSLGFGIVKPRLGPMLHRVLGMGVLYFILGTVEGCLRVLKSKSDQSMELLLAGVPLAVLDAAICWWVFTSLVQTTRTLRLRRNLVKLSLYRHFTNTLIFAVLASVAFMIWSIKQHKLTQCLTDWKEIWVDDAFWHLLFSVILLVIMVLWRPTNNNQRYAFSPLLDAADDEAEEPMMNDAFEGMKMRGPSGQRSASPKPKDAKSKAADNVTGDKTLTDEDLKWIEENIPTSVTDTALPSLLDSDEEIMTTKFEMSKME